MKPILQALGYFVTFLTVYIVTTITTVTLMDYASVVIHPGAFVLTGLLTVALAIIAAVMSHKEWEETSELEKQRIDTDHRYRMKLLEIAEEKDGLEEESTQLQVESQAYRAGQAAFHNIFDERYS